MTENEAIKPKVAIVGGGRSGGKIFATQIALLEELEQYRAIGTIEEFKDLKEKSVAKKEIRAKAIDEFAEKLSTDVESFVAELNGIRADLLTLDYFSEFVFEIAEQLKAGGANE